MKDIFLPLLFASALLVGSSATWVRGGWAALVTRLGLRFHGPAFFGAGVAGCLGGGLYIGLQQLGWGGWAPLRQGATLLAARPLAPALLVFFLYLLAILLLEILFRGLLQPRTGTAVAALSSYLFLPALWQVPSTADWVPIFLLLPLVFAAAYVAQRYGSWGAVALHTASWATAQGLGYFLV